MYPPRRPLPRDAGGRGVWDVRAPEPAVGAEARRALPAPALAGAHRRRPRHGRARRGGPAAVHRPRQRGHRPRDRDRRSGGGRPGRRGAPARSPRRLAPTGLLPDRRGGPAAPGRSHSPGCARAPGAPPRLDRGPHGDRRRRPDRSGAGGPRAARWDRAAPLAQASAENAAECFRLACEPLRREALQRALAVPGRRPPDVTIAAAWGVFTSPLEWVALYAAAGMAVHLKAPPATRPSAAWPRPSRQRGCPAPPAPPRPRRAVRGGGLGSDQGVADVVAATPGRAT